MPEDNSFTFKISLSVLDHLGRHLYRSFATVLGEAISNAWDADAKNVWIYVDNGKNSFFIKDDGVGMNADDFQNKFLKVGYTKRKSGKHTSDGGRPFIGRKGIGKLALLSCSKKITIISKVKGGAYVGGTIDNKGLDTAITQDLIPDDYPLGTPQLGAFGKHRQNHKHGTVIYFQELHAGIKNSLKFMRKTIALYFKFSLIDDSFNIYLNDEIISHKDLADLADATEFAWVINGLDDPYVEKHLANLKNKKSMTMKGTIKGFVASVVKPSKLSIFTTDERVGVDLFVNGRLREANILKHIPTARIPESYFYGQIHYDDLDDTEDRFTSSREGVVADDPKYAKFLDDLRGTIGKIIDEWDDLRIKSREDGDPEGKKLTRRERKSSELFNTVSSDFQLPRSSKNRDKVEGWVDELAVDARFNFSSYAECFISENLVRKFISDKQLPLSKEAKEESEKWKGVEDQNKKKGNISIDIRKMKNDISYLDMDDLANMVDKKDKNKEACLSRDAGEYKPIRDAVAHTARLTDTAKNRLTTVYENIKARIKTLLS